MVLDQDREYISAEPPIIILSTKYHEPLGVINGICKDTISINYNMNSADEISFDVYKRIDDVEEPLWEQIIDFKYIYVPAIQEYFSIEVSIDDSNDTVKHITGTSACEFELSNRYLYGFGVNDDTDWQAQKPQKDEDYIPTLFYRSDPEMKKYSLLDRVLADTNANLSDYSLSHVDASLANIQRKFVVDGQSVYQFLTDSVAKEVECLFVFDSVNRTIGAYDLAYVCENCGYRGEASAKCPKCENTNYIGGEHYSQYYGATIGLGANTSLYISAENYAEQITRNANVDNVFNCLRISGGDDIINTALRYVNPNGSQYLYRYNEDMLNDMPADLKLALESYSVDYEYALGQYANLSNAYYAAVDQKNYLEHTMMPTVTTPTTDAQTEADKLPTSFANFGNVCVTNIRTISNSSADLAVQGLAKVLADARYDIKASGTIGSVRESKYRTWTGTVKITNYGNSEDTATTVQFNVTLELADGDNPSAYPDYLYQRILKQIERDDNTFKSIFKITDINMFKQALKDYGLASLKSFYQTYDTILSILVESNAGDPDYDFHGLEPTLYESMYEPYKAKQDAVEKEMKVREGQIYGLNGDKVGTAKSPYQYADSTHTTESQQWIINQLTNEMQTRFWDRLNFRNYLENNFPGQGERLWRIYCHYRLESTYSNSNYISTGLENPQIIKNAQELFEVARREVVKASEPVYTLSTNLNDLLLDTEEYRNTSVKEARFSDVFRDKFKLGNWLAMQSDDEVFYLRLIALSVDYGSPENINVTFSEASKLSSIISDAQTVLDQAKNMAASYDSVAHQASQGEEAERSVASWMQDGLNAALTKIKSNTNEEITYDKNGLHARSYDDIEEAYGDKQLRITHNVIAFTSDNWQTVRMAMGKSLYAKYDSSYDRVTTDNPGYGVLAEYLNGSYITGSQIVGGDLYSLNYSANNHVGSHIDLNTGYFSLAGGNLKYDGSRLSITVGGKDISEAVDSVTIEYAVNTDPTTAPTTGWSETEPTHQDGEYIWQRTTITYLSGATPKVTTVNITGKDGISGRGIDHYTETYAVNDSGTTHPTSGWSSTRPTQDIKGRYIWTKTITYYTDNTNSESYTVAYQGDDGQGTPGVSVNSITSEYCLKTGNTSTATVVGSWTNSIPTYTSTAYTNGYYYWTREVVYYSNSSSPTYSPSSAGVVDNSRTVAARIAYENQNDIDTMENIEALVVKSDSGRTVAAMKLGASETSSSFTIAADNINFYGKNFSLTTDSMTISSTYFSVSSTGAITSTSGTIGGWEIGSNYIKTKDVAITSNATSSVGLSSSTFTRTINGTSRSSLKFAIGSRFGVASNGTLYASNVIISGQINATSLTLDGATVPASSVSGLATVATTGSYNSLSDKPTIPDTTLFIQKDGTIGSTPSEGSTGFVVSSQGLLKASNAIIYGTLYSSVGKIGGWTIANKQLYSSASGSGSVSGSYSVSGSGDYPWTSDGTISGYTRYASTNNGVNSSYSRCTISISGYQTFAIKVLSNGEKNWDYVCVGNLDKTNISFLKTENTSTEIKWSFYNDEQEATSTSDTRDRTNSSLYKSIVFSNIDGGSHTIEIIFYKDSSNHYGNDKGYFYVDESQCVEGGGSSASDFTLSTTDFSRTIGSVSHSGLRMAVGSQFAIKNDGTVYSTALEAHYNSSNYIRIANGCIRFIGDNDNVGFKVGPINTTGVPTLKLIYNSGYETGYIKAGSSGKFVLDNFNQLLLPSSASGGYLLATSSSSVQGRPILSVTDISVNSLSNIGATKTGTIDTTASLASGSTVAVGSISLAAGTWVVFAKAQLSSNVGTDKVLQAGLGSSGSAASLSESTSQGNKVNVVLITSSSSTQTIYLNMNQNSGSAMTAASESWIKAVRIK